MKEINFKSYEENEIQALSSLRGFLALVVALCHCAQIFWLPVSGLDLIENKIISTIGNMSVVIFFVISGMMISYSALKQQASGRFYAWEFFKRRFFRIYPPIFMLLLVLILYYLHRFLIGSEAIALQGNELYIARDSFTNPLDNIISVLLMQPSSISQVNGVLWSLYLEWWLYMSFMCVFLAITTRSLIVKIIALIFAITFIIICWQT